MPWFIRAAANRGKFWSYEETDSEKGDSGHAQEMARELKDDPSRLSTKYKSSGEI